MGQSLVGKQIITNGVMSMVERCRVAVEMVIGELETVQGVVGAGSSRPD